ncbi:SRPBCC family protein [Prauserella muralis]|uniref:Polyketide cyclase n=1 Tax=Prauserella muralis TaxID=588067 RepID=A0A2V4B2I6_9PSEU|nr:SRPBCC family protein [Prauserella muralis]PXY27345.1 polyketide cyclase [Prauserella muralis]TWE22971.1 polyketide cyclase/dehydrase/lipid transport protein [Prauserella muralis]
MAEFEHQRVIPAEPRAVFEVAAQPELLNSWTPDGVDVEPSGPGVLRAWVSSGSEVADEPGFVEANADELRLEWGGAGEQGYGGWLQVEPDGGDGRGSVATLHLTFTGGQSETLDGEISEEADRRVEEALDRLAALVAEQTAGESP